MEVGQEKGANHTSQVPFDLVVAIEARPKDSFSRPTAPAWGMSLDIASLRVHRCVPEPLAYRPGMQKGCPHALSSKAFIQPHGFGLRVAGLLLSQFCFLCIFAGKMLTLPNKPLCSSNLCCLTFDSPLLSASATFASQTKGPRKKPQPGLARKRMRRAFHPIRRQMDRLSLGQSFGK